ncbi:MAG: PTS ascorbate transporter subunit IIC [Firmicutes bacterium]|nr:PTS ascorbate transporter subunit IIC [Bacillota bacterium]MCL5039730.1 PTS ascorbate transporter subunit IIC [Bacillota bacterium]
MASFWNVLLHDVLSQPAVLIGLTALLGLALQGKAFHQVVTGTFKSTMGYLILVAGAGVVVGALNNFGALFQQGFGVHGVVPNNEAIVALAVQTYGRETALIMVLGLVMNVVFARFTPLKYIFLSGHHTFYMAVLLAAILVSAGLSGASMILLGAILLGFTMVLFPAIGQPFIRRITGSDDIAFGHFSTVGAALSGWIGRYAGNPEENTEDWKLPESLTFLRDTSIAIAVVMAVLFLVVALASGKAATEKLSNGQNYIVFSFLQALTFAAGVYVILAGVRMIIAEIVPAFRGIALKIVPKAKPALDCPVVYPYAPTAVFLGFLSSFAAGIVSMFVQILLGLPVIVPGVVPHFFCGANAGVFGNATGGRRGALIGSFAHGLLISFLPIVLLGLLGQLGYANTTFSDSDFLLTGIAVGSVVRIFK